MQADTEVGRKEAPKGDVAYYNGFVKIMGVTYLGLLIAYGGQELGDSEPRRKESKNGQLPAAAMAPLTAAEAHHPRGSQPGRAKPDSGGREMESITWLHNGTSVTFIQLSEAESPQVMVTDPRQKGRLQVTQSYSLQLSRLVMADAGPYCTLITSKTSIPGQLPALIA
ncbi:hypothetical protein MC885_000744 [Smutsia gigantea]|nr:hypothetical protein MC885_000744 [Smutsia gigantea]